MESRTAIVFGGTGLIGRAIIEELNASGNYSTIKIFSRKSTLNPERSKIKEFVINFDRPESFSEDITGDDIYICLGTTIKKAGSVKRMEEIDRDLPVILAKKARENGVKRLAVVSSIGADPRSSNYYLRIKGEMEQKISSIDFETIVIARPSLLLGIRNDKRFTESAGKFFMRVFGIFLFGKYGKYRAIEGKDVARAMIRLIKETDGNAIFESDKLQKIADRK